MDRCAAPPRWIVENRESKGDDQIVVLADLEGPVPFVPVLGDLDLECEQFVNELTSLVRVRQQNPVCLEKHLEAGSPRLPDLSIGKCSTAVCAASDDPNARA